MTLAVCSSLQFLKVVISSPLTPKGALKMSHKIIHYSTLPTPCLLPRVMFRQGYHLIDITWYIQLPNRPPSWMSRRNFNQHTPAPCLMNVLSHLRVKPENPRLLYLFLHCHSNFMKQVISLVFKKRSNTERRDPHSPRTLTVKLHCLRFHQLKICLC